MAGRMTNKRDKSAVTSPSTASTPSSSSVSDLDADVHEEDSIDQDGEVVELKEKEGASGSLTSVKNSTTPPAFRQASLKRKRDLLGTCFLNLVDRSDGIA